MRSGKTLLLRRVKATRFGLLVAISRAKSSIVCDGNPCGNSDKNLNGLAKKKPGENDDDDGSSDSSGDVETVDFDARMRVHISFLGASTDFPSHQIGTKREKIISSKAEKEPPVEAED